MIDQKKNLIIFMPYIDIGGVEKNLFIISNYLSTIIKNIKVVTISNIHKKNFNKNIKLIFPKKNYSKTLFKRIKYLICLFELFKYLKKNQNSVVLSFQANIYCIIICKLLKIKIIIRNNSSPDGWGHNLVKKFIYKKIISQADEVIVNSQDFKNQIQGRFHVNAKCIYNPLDISDIKKKSKIKIHDKFFKDELRIINVGRLTDQKDQLTLLKAIKNINKRIKIKLMIIGDGEEKKNLVDYIIKNNLRNIVKIKSFIKNPYPYILKSELFILTSKYEGLPNVLLEASALNKFIISTNCPTGPKEILNNGKGGFLINVGDYKKLTKKIIYYYENRKNLKKKIIHNYKNLKRFDSQTNLLKYLKVVLPYLKN